MGCIGDIRLSGKARSLAKGPGIDQRYAVVPGLEENRLKIENIRIVMVGTTHPGNIGAAARAMHNMCFSRLSLVDPQCPVGEIAYARASGANCLLDDRETHADLASAIAGCHYVIAASARRRHLSWPELDPVQAADTLSALGDEVQAAIVFGREHSGLTNEELQLCNFMVRIPTNPAFSSLNVAAAIQVLCYEVYRRQGESFEPPRVDPQDLPAPSAEVEGYFEHLQRVLEDSGFLDPQQPGLVMQRLRRLYLRSELTHNEINILRGMLRAVESRPD
jgi:tRNA (cytidine32/uridine32-2'-O)-methyltransferase